MCRRIAGMLTHELEIKTGADSLTCSCAGREITGAEELFVDELRWLLRCLSKCAELRLWWQAGSQRAPVV